MCLEPNDFISCSQSTKLNEVNSPHKKKCLCSLEKTASSFYSTIPD